MALRRQTARAPQEFVQKQTEKKYLHLYRRGSIAGLVKRLQIQVNCRRKSAQPSAREYPVTEIQSPSQRTKALTRSLIRSV
jgi:hypothetical protein